ncbi:MAG: N-acetyltransferase [Candidatus Omnitrophica bacterium]|nr:N-acetyltransferase [Candidatus Omnitrophota bacterium]
METVNIENPRQLVKNVKLGTNVVLREFINLYGCRIGDNSRVGTFVEIQKNSSVGKNCKIQSHSFICEGVDIMDNVFIGHNVSFINDKYPRSVNPDGTLMNDADWSVSKTLVGKGASIGTSATILSGVTIGENSIIGAGSVVTKDIPANVIAAGNPARVLRTVGGKSLPERGKRVS